MAALTTREPQLRVQINQLDYTIEPSGELDKSNLLSAPVIRIYGTSSFGETACVHVHQVYPYFYVEYLGNLDPNNVKRYTATLASSLNHAIALSLKRDPDSPRSQYVRAILLVKGVHFYGFHARYSPFLKIYLVDPGVVSRAVTILQSGTVMSSRFRVYESHLSFLLQFMCDFNLYGCGWIDLGEVYLRGDEGLSEVEELSVHPVLTRSPHHRQSRLPLEVDVIAPHILNRWQLHMRNIHHELEIPELQLPAEPLIPSIRELWEDERRRRSAQGLDPSPEMPVDPSKSSRKPGSGWVAEERWLNELRKRIQREKEVRPVVDSPQEWEKWTMTAFESVEALWDREYRTWKSSQHQNSCGTEEPESGNQDVEVQVDSDMLSSQEMAQRLLVAEEEGRGADDGNDYTSDGHNEEEELSDQEQQPLQREMSPDNPFVTDAKTNDFTNDFTLPDLPNVGFEMDEVLGDEHSSEQTMSPVVTPARRRRASTGTRASKTPTCNKTVSLTHRELSTGEQSSPLEAFRPVKRRKIEARDDLDPSSSMRVSCGSSVSQSMQSVRYQPYATAKVVNVNGYVYGLAAPTGSDLMESLEFHNLPQQLYREPYYSNISDLSRKTRTYAGSRFCLKGGQGISYLPEWEKTSGHEDQTGNILLHENGPRFLGPWSRGWEYASCPPSVKQTKRWLRSNERNRVAVRRPRSQIEGPTLKNIYGLGSSPGSRDPNIRGNQEMSNLSLEVFATCDDRKTPDPQKDEITAVVYTFQKHESEPMQTGILTLSSGRLNKSRLQYMPIEEAATELDLLNMLVDIVIQLDPDILTGWEVQKSSWGYCNTRAAHYGYEFTELISRAPPGRGANDYEQWGSLYTSNLKVSGRHVLNAWRIIRSEQSLHSYTLENVAFHILRKRVPHFNQSALTRWYHSPVPAHSAALLRYLSSRSRMTLDILNKIEIVSKTAEFARIFGVDFFSVIRRGSQFKVESFLFRIGKPENYLLLSPSKSDVGKQNAAECMPLIMEPMSGFYSSPLVVLDFQSLYPSIMIAYNYCYSTCLGRVADFKGRNKFGVVDLDQPPGILNQLKEHIHVAPNGIIYVKPEVRKGLLGRMLVELLETRVMVKQAMKSARDNKPLSRVLDARQLGLKYISNVTYGYTSATFSGRMPAVEIADSIVQSGRETLEKAITVINSTKKWGAQVVYGDTDSVFVHLPGKTREQAFRIGNDIADTITLLNPSPIKLRFEKVYHPCVLLAKKRYVGFKFESPDELVPVFDAKGIETVRRDGVLAQQKMTENCLKILFRSQDLSEIKSYCYRSWAKLMEDKASVQDFIFHKEVKMGTYSDKGLPPPGAMLAAKRMLLDLNDEPQYGERVPYVIVRGPPGSRLVDRAMDPLEFMRNSQLRLDATYYITRVLIPPLERILNLVGADVRQWFSEMPKPLQLDPTMSPRKSKKDSPSKMRINDHFLSTQCLACLAPASDGDLCDSCRSAPQETATVLGYRMQAATHRLVDTHLVCASCVTSTPCEPVECDSVDCPWFFARKKAEKQAQFLSTVEESYRHSANQPPVVYVIDEESD